MQQRIVGLTTEYSLIAPSGAGQGPPGVKNLTGDPVLQAGARPRGPNDFLHNGARLSRAPGWSPEYATPECDNPRDLVIHDKAGERLVEEVLLAAERRFRDNGLPSELLLVKASIDSVGHPSGCPEHYLVERGVNFHQLAELLIPFFVTRQVFAGAGKVLKTRMGNHYYISQRAQHIYQEISGATTSSRGIINTRDEPHADEKKYRRLQVMVGDANMADLATYLKVGTTAIVLSMIEDGAIKRDLALEDPVRAIKEISHDVACKRRVKLKRGKEFSAIEIQREYLDLALEYYQGQERSPQVADLLEKWQYVLDKLAEDPMTLHRELDWVIKRELINAYISRKGCSFEDQRVFMLDLKYHDIKRTRGLYYLMVQDRLIDRLATEWEIERAMTTPPQTTRAKVRSDFIKFANEKNKSYDVGWSYLKLNDRYQRTILCKDPFKPWDPRVEQLILS